jgi:hypothetical protein
MVSITTDILRSYAMQLPMGKGLNQRKGIKTQDEDGGRHTRRKKGRTYSLTRKKQCLDCSGIPKTG